MLVMSNNNISVMINELGAELTSLVDIKTGKEFIWQDKPYHWGGHAPVLFPAVGRVYQDKYVFDGKEYKMPKHGFASKKMFSSRYISSSSIELTLIQDDETKSMYPFDYSLSIVFSIFESSLSISFSIKNMGDTPMYSSIGFHPGYNIDIGGMVEFEKEEPDIIYYSGETAITDTESKMYFRENRYLDISKNTFDGDKTISIEGPNSGSVILYDKNKKPFLKHTFGKQGVIWIWSISNAPYVCIEPWTGSIERFSCSELENKKGIIRIDKGKEYSTKSTITIL